jgi:hypothetical protein
MLTFNQLSLLDIRQKLMAATAGSLGQYLVPGQPNEPAIRVLDRPLEAGVKVAVNHAPDVWQPALEIVINPVTNFDDLPSNFRQSQMAESYTIYLIWHDQRQYQRQALVTIMAAFKGYAPQLTSLGSSELHVQQHVLKITNKLMVTLNA